MPSRMCQEVRINGLCHPKWDPINIQVGHHISYNLYWSIHFQPGHPDVIHEASTCSSQGFDNVSVALRWSSGPACAWGRRFCSHTIHGNGIVTRWAPNSYKWGVITPLRMTEEWIGNLGYFTPTPGVTTILTTGVWAHLVTTFWVSFFLMVN